MITPQIIEVDLSEFYFDSLKRIIKAYEKDYMEGAEREILTFMDLYEIFVGSLEEK